MSELIRDYLDELLNSLGGASPPIDPSVLKSLYGRRDYAAMLGWIKNSMRLDLRVGLRIVDAPEPSPPMWIETPQPMPAYGAAGFRNARVIVNARRDALEAKSFVWVVAGFSHELSHVVLFAIGHRLQRDEKAVDLTAMILGYPSFVGAAEIARSQGLVWSILLAIALLPAGVLFWRGPPRKTWRLGYLTRAEAAAARDYLAQGRRPWSR
ncbi:MAG: hypothetical protein ABSC25_03490 [Roseiarcus sp.]|jgi:hypothetical protein